MGELWSGDDGWARLGQPGLSWMCGMIGPDGAAWPGLLGRHLLYAIGDRSCSVGLELGGVGGRVTWQGGHGE